jgi:hypothetical protein
LEYCSAKRFAIPIGKINLPNALCFRISEYGSIGTLGNIFKICAVNSKAAGFVII